MCGITGFFSPHGSLVGNQSIIRKMVDTLRHRGPDSDGIWVDNSKGVALGHRRLKIIDLTDAGHQPMHSLNGKFVLILNGEIYNHQEIRLHLRVLGHVIQWSGTSDTETLLAAIEILGFEDAIKLSVGMFAIALWDANKEELLLARDRLGEKPLYFGVQKSGASSTFFFGSELRSLQAHPSFNATISRDGLLTYLRYGYFGGEQSIYDGIFKLLPGSILKISKRKFSPEIYSYWSGEKIITYANKHKTIASDSENIEHLGKLLVDSVSNQMISDVSLGVFLSGGVDSSLIASLMQSRSETSIKSFSIGFEEDAYNEAPFAKEVARHIGTEHLELYLTSSKAMDTIYELGKIYDEPFADSSQIPTQLLSCFARNHVTVALTGDGADELFCGYNRYLLTNSSWKFISCIPISIRKKISSGILALPPHIVGPVIQKSAFLRKWFGSGERLHKAANSLIANSPVDLYRRQISVIFEPELFLIGSTQFSEPDLLITDFFSSLGIIDGMMANDMLNYLPNDILTKVDRASMSVGLETRAPFLDHRVVEYAWQLPLNSKIRKTQAGVSTKWILRQLLYKNVPQHLIERPKAGFGVPISAWLRGPLRDWADDLLNETRLINEGFFHPEPIRKLWKEHLSGQFNRQHQLWVFLMFQQWFSEKNKLENF
jgi:asparagine synthase (glutamine-hydrolysing)